MRPMKIEDLPLSISWLAHSHYIWKDFSLLANKILFILILSTLILILLQDLSGSPVMFLLYWLVVFQWKDKIARQKEFRQSAQSLNYQITLIYNFLLKKEAKLKILSLNLKIIFTSLMIMEWKDSNYSLDSKSGCLELQLENPHPQESTVYGLVILSWNLITQFLIMTKTPFHLQRNLKSDKNLNLLTLFGEIY